MTPAASQRPRAVLFDRDGTLVVDVPYNGDPALVRPMPTAQEAVTALRAAQIPIGVVSNQSGIARGLLTAQQVDAVNRRVDEILGPFDTWQVCPHQASDDCSCRKPQPALVHLAAAELGVASSEVVVIGDIGSDLGAATAAGADSILVPTDVTLPEEIRSAPASAPTLLAAVTLLLDLPARPSPADRASSELL